MKTYLVGGAVRDRMMHLEPKDRDWVIVGATAEDIAQMEAEGYKEVGADFPVYLHPTTGEEYALARIERKVGAGYHGFEVQTGGVTIEEDLSRRDLTINSMAMTENDQLIDPYGGIRDLHNHVLRHTSEAFAEDPLRVLRIARFSARFPQFTIAPDTIELCRKVTMNGELNELSRERIWTELAKGFQEAAPAKFLQALEDTYALQHSELLTLLFGRALSEFQIRVCEAIGKVEVNDRLAVAIGALCPTRDISGVLPGRSRRIQDCYENVAMARGVDHSAQSLYSLLKAAGAFTQGDEFRNLLDACTVMEMAGDRRLRFTQRRLSHAAQIAKLVTVADFPDVKGKALGEAIQAKIVSDLSLAFS